MSFSHVFSIWMFMLDIRRHHHLSRLVQLSRRKHAVTPALRHHPNPLNHVNQTGVSVVKIKTSINRIAIMRIRRTCATTPKNPTIISAPTKTKYRRNTRENALAPMETDAVSRNQEEKLPQSQINVSITIPEHFPSSIACQAIKYP